MRRSSVILLALCALMLTSCQMLYYSVMEHLGKEKRDILVQRLVETRKDTQATDKQLKTTLEAFKEVTGFDGGDLERTYNKLNKEFEHSRDRAHKLSEHIDAVDRVAKDLFSEWQKEISAMHNQSLKTRSTALLRTARQRHTVYMAQMHRTEAKIKPVLQAFSDQVIFLKHNLNAKAISSLKNTSAQVDAQASALTAEMEASAAEADRYIQTLSQSDAT